MGAILLFPAEGNAAEFRRNRWVSVTGGRTQEVRESAGGWLKMAYPPVRRAVEVIRAWQQASLTAAEGRLVMDPDVMAGVPVVRNTRIPAYVILDCLAESDSASTVASKFPSLAVEDVHAVLAYAAGLTGG